MTKRVGAAVTGVLAAIASGCVPSQAEIARSEPDNRTAVEVMVARQGKLVERGSYWGTLQPWESVMVSAEVGGQLVDVLVDEGVKVKAGDLLAVIDEEPFRLTEEDATNALEAGKIRVAQLEQAIGIEQRTLEAQLNQATAAVEMARARNQLIEKGARSEEKKQAKAGVEAAKAGKDNARAELERVQAMHSGGAATQQQLDAAQAAWERAAATHEQAVQAHRIVVSGAREEDRESARASVRQAEAALAAVTASQDSLEVRRKELEAARIQIRVAENTLARAKLNRSKTKLASPLERDGIVSLRNVDRGEMVGPGMPLFEIVDMSRMKLVLQVPGRDVNHLQAGDTMPLSCVGSQGGELTGKVHYVAVKADDKNFVFPVEVEIANPSGLLRGGQMCQANPDLAEYDEILVPADVVIDTQEGKLVMVVEEGKSRERPVKVAVVRGGKAAISSGLSDGDGVVVVGERLVHDGDNVKVVGERDGLSDTRADGAAGTSGTVSPGANATGQDVE